MDISDSVFTNNTMLSSVLGVIDDVYSAVDGIVGGKVGWWGGRMICRSVDG